MNQPVAGSKEAPVQVFRLGQYLAEEMEERNWTSLDVAARMGGEFGIDALVVDIILCLDDDRCVLKDADMIRLERAFGVSEGFFHALDKPWRDHPDRRAPYDAPEHILSGVKFREPKP